MLNEVAAVLATNAILFICAILTTISGAILGTLIIRDINKAILLQDNIKTIQNAEKRDDKDEIEVVYSDATTAPNPKDEKIHVKLPKYDGPNPFMYKSLTLYQKLKIIFFCTSGIVYIKLVSVFLFICGLYLLSIPPSNKLSRFLIRCLFRFILFTFGFYWIPTISDESKSISNNYRVVVANHNTIFDGLVILSLINGCVAAKKELSYIPIIGRIMTNGLQTLWIERSGKLGRNNAKKQILDQVSDNSLPPLIIFPQGTVSNIETLTAFKAGAFIPKATILPISLNWNANKYVDHSYVAEMSDLSLIIYCGCCQFINFCHVYVSNEYTPNTAEQNDISLFAENVRNLIASNLKKNALKFECTPHSVGDYMLFQSTIKSSKLYLDHMIMGDVVSLLRLRSKTVSYLADKFKALDLNGDGYIDYNEFCIAFNQDPIENEAQMRPCFDVFDTESIDSMNYQRIGFDEFLVGVSLCFMDNMFDDAVRVMFNGCLYDNECVTKTNILKIYRWSVDESKFEDFADGYKEWMGKMNAFVNIVFREEEQLKFDEFYERVTGNGMQYMVQHFMQSVLTMRLKIKLQKKDFALTDETKNKIFVNPAASHIKSESIQSVR